MARQSVIKISCDRCKKATEAPPEPVEGQPAKDGLYIDAAGIGLGQIAFDDLCARCLARVTDLIGLIAKQKDSTEEPAASQDLLIVAPPPEKPARKTKPKKETTR